MNDVTILETGDGEWGLALDGSSNPTFKNYVACADRAQAERIQEIVANVDDIRIMAAYFCRGSTLNCPHWGVREGGNYGPCRNCANCRLAEVLGC